MLDNASQELYQQVILDHNRRPKNFGRLSSPTHEAEGYNPLCGDHLVVSLRVNQDNIIEEIAFEGDGCAISKASASMMTQTLKGKSVEEAERIFHEFHRLLLGELKPNDPQNHLGKLNIFSNIWHFPSRVKCASLGWHTFHGALHNEKQVSTEE